MRLIWFCKTRSVWNHCNIVYVTKCSKLWNKKYQVILCNCLTIETAQKYKAGSWIYIFFYIFFVPKISMSWSWNGAKNSNIPFR